MTIRRLPNGNLLVPAVALVNGALVTGVKEVAPGTPDYLEWVGETVRNNRTAVE